MLSISDGLPDPRRDRRRGFVEGERDRPFEALWPGDQYTNAAPERFRGDPAFIRLSDMLAAGLDGRLDALPPGSGDPLAIEDGQRHSQIIVEPSGSRPRTSRREDFRATTRGRYGPRRHESDLPT